VFVKSEGNSNTHDDESYGYILNFAGAEVVESDQRLTTMAILYSSREHTAPC